MKQSYEPNSMPGKPALLAAGSVCVLLANPALAVELGELKLQSALGQPLRASVAFALAPNEKINDQCVYLNAAGGAQGLPQVTRATAKISGQQILLRGDQALREPMMSLQLAVNCPYTAKVRREYLLLLSPARMMETATETAAPIADNASRPATVADSAPRQAPVADARRPVNTFTAPRRSEPRRAAEPVAAGSNYRVQSGDTLSEIAARIADRKVGLWNAVDRIYQANPGAFLNNDINRLIAGATLDIPATVTSGSGVSDVAASTVSPAADAPAPATAYPTVDEAAAPVTAAERTSTAADPQTDAAAQLQGPSATVAEPAATLQPVTAPDASPALEQPAEYVNVFKDAVVADDPATTPAPEVFAPPTVSIPDTDIKQSQPQAAPVVSTGTDSGTSSWLVWLGGAGIAIFLALLLFGRRVRELVQGEDQAAELDETLISDITATQPVDLSQTIGKANALQVDEILANRESFDTGEDVDVALDYTFGSSGEHDQDIDFVVEGEQTDESELATRLMPTAKETTPSEEDDDYDMSMVLDVTRQNFRAPGETTSSLDATEIAPADDNTMTGRTSKLSSDLDYKILEQDYEDELSATLTLSATQALSEAIDSAARELEERAQDVDAETSTSQISMAADLDATAEVAADLPGAMEADAADGSVTDSLEAVDVAITDKYQALDGSSADDTDRVPVLQDEETDLTEALAASMEELDLEFDIDDDDDTEVLTLEDTSKQKQSKVG